MAQTFRRVLPAPADIEPGWKVIADLGRALGKDLGFTDADRVENIRRVAEAAKLFVDAGLIVMVSFISPFRSERRMARELLGDGEFVEVGGSLTEISSRFLDLAY